MAYLKIKLGLISLSIIATSILIGFIIGYFSSKDDDYSELVNYYNSLIQDYDKNEVNSLIKLISVRDIEENYR